MDAGSQDFWASKWLLYTEVLFSQQFQLQRRLEVLTQEMISLFGGQQYCLQNMHTRVKRNAIQPVVCPVVHLSLQQSRRGGDETPGLMILWTRTLLYRGWWAGLVVVSSFLRIQRTCIQCRKSRSLVWMGAKPAKDFTFHERGQITFVTASTGFFGLLSLNWFQRGVLLMLSLIRFILCMAW
jgi:hypothetical protein